MPEALVVVGSDSEIGRSHISSMCKGVSNRRSQLQRGFSAVVIGGGPGGAAAANALARSLPSGSRICVIERAPEMASDKPRGAGLSLVANGQRALAGIDPALLTGLLQQQNLASVPETINIYQFGAPVTPDSQPTTTSVEGTLHSKPPATAPPAQLAPRIVTVVPHPDGTIRVGWHELAQSLTRSLSDVGVEVHSGCKFVDYSESEDGSGLHVTLEDNGAQVVKLQTGLLVGADGFYSNVRQRCLGDGPPQFVGVVFWRARVRGELARSLGFTQSAAYSGHHRIGVVYPIAGGDFVWTLSCPVEELKLLGIDYQDILTAKRQEAASQGSDHLQSSMTLGQAACKRAQQAFGGIYDQPLLDLVAATDAASIAEHALYLRPAAECSDDWFGRGRVVILGDAAHPTRPTGQGTNLALEDAYELGRCISQGREGDLLNSLDTFRQRRAARVGLMMRQAEMMGSAAYTADGVRASMKGPFADNKEYQAFVDSESFLPVL